MNRAETFQRRGSKCLDGAFVANIGRNGQGLDTPGSPRPAAASRAVSSKSASTTRIPAAAKRSASARPIPLAAPVTTAIFPGASSMTRPFPGGAASQQLIHGSAK